MQSALRSPASWGIAFASICFGMLLLSLQSLVQQNARDAHAIAWNVRDATWNAAIASQHFVAGGANPSNQTFAISDTGVTLDNWSATKTQSWVTLSPASGTAAGNLTVGVSCSGLPTGTYADTVTVSSTTTGILNSPQTAALSLTVLGTVNVTPVTLPNGIWTIPYSQTLAASGGTGPYTFAVSTGTLPAGLSLNSSTGVISGSPAIPVGTTSFWVTATDSLSVTSPQQLLSITVPSPGTAFQLGGYGIRH